MRELQQQKCENAMSIAIIVNDMRMESEKQSGNILRRKYNKIWTKKLAQNLKEGKYTSKTEILNRRVNKIDMIKNKEEDVGEENGVTREAQQQKCKNATPNTDSTNDSIYNNNTSAGRNINNGSEKLINTETKSVTTNDEGHKGEEEEEVEAEAEADENSKIPNNSNGSGSNKSSSNTVITLQLLEKQVRKMKSLQTRINGEVAEEGKEEAAAEAEAEEDANSKIPKTAMALVVVIARVKLWTPQF